MHTYAHIGVIDRERNRAREIESESKSINSVVVENAIIKISLFVAR